MNFPLKFAGVGFLFVMADPTIISNVPFVTNAFDALIRLSLQNVQSHNVSFQQKQDLTMYEKALQELDTVAPATTV